MKNKIDNKFKSKKYEINKVANKKKIWLVVCILGIVILLFGITFAIFRYSKTGNNSSLVLGDIYMSSKENSIVLNELEPMNPSEGIDKGSKYSFSVEGYNTSNKDIYYGVYLNYGSEETGKTRFKDEDLMMYLTENKNGETRAVYGPGSVKDFNDKMIYANTINAATKKEEKVEINYELTVWLSDNIVITDTEEKYEGKNVYTTSEYANSYASIDVKVYGDFEEKKIRNAYENITGTTISTNENYEIKDDIKDAAKTDEDVKIVITTNKEAKLYITNLDTSVKKEETLTLKNNLYTFERVETDRVRYSYYFEYLDGTISQIYYYNVNVKKYETVEKPTNICINKVYDGTNQLITSIETNDSYTISNNKQKNVGTYQVVVKLNDGYMWDDDTESDITLNCNIEKRDLTIIPDATSKEYGEYDPTLTYKYTGNVEGETPKFTGTLQRALGEEIGSYLINKGTLALTDNGDFKKNNYNLVFDTREVKFTILEKTAENLTITLEYTETTYDGTEKKPKVVVKDGTKTLTSGTDYDVTYQDNINAGVAKVTIKFKGSYSGSSGKNFTIKSKSVAIPTNSYCNSLFYNGTSQTLTKTAGEGYTFSNNTGINAISYVVTATLKTNYIWSDGTSTNKTFTCSIDKKTATVKAASSSKTYNGSELTKTSGCESSTGLLTNHTATCINKGTITNAGNTSNVLSEVIIKNGNDDVTSNYNITKQNGTLTVNKAPTTITLSENQATINYTDEITFTVKTSQAGSLSIQNGNDSVVTVEPTSIDGVVANVEQEIRLAGKEKGTSVITIVFTPSSSNYSSSSVTYTLNTIMQYCATFDKNGAASLNGATDENLKLCCTVTNGSSCDVVSPTIVPIDNYEVLGWATAETATSAAYSNGATITLTTDDTDFFAITRSLDSTRQTKTINFNINGADSFTYSGTTYTTNKAITCKTDYGYNGEALPDSCTITLPTITRSGGTVYGWNEDNEARTATHGVGSTYEVYDATTLNAITSKPIKLSFNANSGSTTLTTMVGQAYNYDKGADFVIPSYDNSNMCRSATNFTNFSKGSFAANGYLLGYKYIGLTDVAGSSEVKYCQGNYIYIEKDTTLHAIWNEDYATTLVTSGDNLNLRTGCGTSYGTTGSSMSGSTTIYVNQEGSKYSSGYMGYWVKYGSRNGCASCKYLRSFLYYPASNSCTRTDYVCNGGSAADITLSPSNAVLNLKKSDMLSTTLSVDSRCGTWTVSNSNTSIVTATKASSGVQLTAVSGSVAENSSKTATITVTGQWGCTATATVTVKNTNATKPTVTISIDGDSSTCSESYIKGATATITCSSPLIPITGFSGGTITNDGTNTKTATVSLSSTGSKTVTASCSNEEGTTNVSKAVTIKVKSASSACGCDSYGTKTTYGSWVTGQCFSSNKTSTSTKEWSCKVTYEYDVCNASKAYICKSRTIKKTTYCKSHKTCCHT